MARTSGTLGLTSAALHHGWAVLRVPRRPLVLLSRGRRLPAATLGVDVHRAELAPSVVPQVVIREPGLLARPDLVDVDLRIVVAADSFEWHGGRHRLSEDARRVLAAG